MAKRTKRRLTIRGVLSALIILVLVRSIIMGSMKMLLYAFCHWFCFACLFFWKSI